MSQDSVIGIATRLRAGRFGVRKLVEVKDFLFSTPVQTGPGAHLASCAVDTGALSRG
jgi:hypothetical protein